ncbi:Flavin reductase domain-containing protein [Pseudomonas amygdali pv. photiniae]|uniref:Flavin reductase n=8 Tax=Pseudomonas syringae group TaxID=136849 RepID=A0A2K4WTW8_PSESX|nr:4-hydroxyphenylacetate 3-monooxygenase [Pseudomonas savastanoi]KPW65006.1 Flavin reductase domain-containing protein [Pseudomonas amygdali pv. ciccaronei]KPX16750.1 Flavin reductase domain-containing protein [Pseudomonas amygdali pv. dendropanacis]KPX78443.1 Flavin reductase domain-containing protein [Pseudomonas amygdali pv. photiniae]KPY44336.1 Flavin reductase domain-containing protein [Pseudomonas savastanoi pv. retacarpa]KPY78626.1 Flavin reductase domain-containing protein [Pseudomona
MNQASRLAARANVPEPQTRLSALESPDMDVAAFKKAMRRLTSTVTLVATEHEGTPYGMAATAVSSVCSDPPSILVCINHSASVYLPLLERGKFSVNLLQTGQAELVSVFGGAVNGPARFESGDWQQDQGVPYLRTAQATLFCSVAQRMTCGTHEIIIGLVEKTAVAEVISPLLWQDGKPAASTPLLV